MAGMLSKFAGAAAVVALTVSSTAAIASPRPVSAAVSAPSPQSATNAWSTLSVMSSASSSTAALQDDYAYRDDRGIPLPVIAVLLATLGVFIWILVQDDDDGFTIRPVPPPSSPV